MSAAFVNQLRTRGDVIQLASAGAASITVRVESPEVWDVVRVAASAETAAHELKQRALAALLPGVDPGEIVMKLRGFEVLDERATLASLGAVEGSIFLLTYRRRRPVR